MTTISRTIGAEFEFDGPTNAHDTALSLRQEPINVTHRGAYSDGGPQPPYDWLIEPDADFRNDARNPLEAKTRAVLPGQWDQVIPPMLKSLKRQGARIDRRAAYHLWVDVPEIAEDWSHLKSLMRLVYHYENVLYAMVQPLARHMGSGEMPSLTKIEACHTDADYRRYVSGYPWFTGIFVGKAADPTPLVEFRWHQGTLDADEAALWARLMCGLVDCAVSVMHPAHERVPNTTRALEEFIKRVADPSDYDLLRNKHRLDEPGRSWNTVPRPASGNGPGDIAAKLIATLYKQSGAGTCGCAAIREKMNTKGWLWCIRNRRALVDEIVESARKKKVLIDPGSFWQMHRQMRRQMKQKELRHGV